MESRKMVDMNLFVGHEQRTQAQRMDLWTQGGESGVNQNSTDIYIRPCVPMIHVGVQQKPTL